MSLNMDTGSGIVGIDHNPGMEFVRHDPTLEQVDDNMVNTCDRGMCAPPPPHYSMPITDDGWIQRNIQMSDMMGLDMPEQLNTHHYSGNWAMEEAKAMTKINYHDYALENYKKRSDWCLPTRFFWQNLNSRQYIRGTSDSLDCTIGELNNTTSGWYNGRKGNRPGGAPYRNPYTEIKHDNILSTGPYLPYKDRIPTAPMNGMGNKHYFYSIYDVNKWPEPFCRAPGRSEIPKTAGPYIRYPEQYN